MKNWCAGGDRTHDPWLRRAEKLLDVNCFNIPEIVAKPHKYSLLIFLSYTLKGYLYRTSKIIRTISNFYVYRFLTIAPLLKCARLALPALALETKRTFSMTAIVKIFKVLLLFQDLS